MATPLRLVVYDATQVTRPPRALGVSWNVGARLYRVFGGIDASFGARSFAEALAWLERATRARTLAELQFWGHGKWGRALIARESLDRSALGSGHALRPKLDAIRERLAPDALIWFRTCETLGAVPGQDFARALGEHMGARIAGHTFEIGYWQSGLHELAPGGTPEWDPREGLAEGDPVAPLRAFRSKPGYPNTITCLTSRFPSEMT